MIQTALVAGIGTPVAYGLIKGMEKAKRKATLRDFAVVGLSAFAVSAIASYFMATPANGAATVRMAVPTRNGRRMSVSDVTVQLGRYAGGVDYPGQMTGGMDSNGSLVYID
jgi:hypothetical protein